MRAVNYGPLDMIGTVSESKLPPLMVLCRAPADDGWLAVEAGTAVIYNIFDSVAHHYTRWEGQNANHVDLKSRPSQARLLARAKWYHRPDGIETVGAPKRPRKRVAA